VRGWLGCRLAGSLRCFATGCGAVICLPPPSLGSSWAPSRVRWPQFGPVLIMVLLHCQMLSGGVTPRRDAMPELVTAPLHCWRHEYPLRDARPGASSPRRHVLGVVWPPVSSPCCYRFGPFFRRGPLHASAARITAHVLSGEGAFAAYQSGDLRLGPNPIPTRPGVSQHRAKGLEEIGNWDETLARKLSTIPIQEQSVAVHHGNTEERACSESQRQRPPNIDHHGAPCAAVHPPEAVQECS